MIEMETAWDRVAVVAAAIFFGIVVLCVVVGWGIAVVAANELSSVPAAATPVNTTTVLPTPTFPVEVLKEAPSIIPTLEPVPLIQPPVPAILPVIFDEEQSGLRNISEYFTIRRQNVTGYKSMTVKTTVYGVREFTQVKWYSDGWGRYMDQFAPKGEKYVFVFLAEFVDGNTPREDPGIWYFGPGLFRLQVDGRLYDQDTDFVPTNRIKELEEIESFSKIKGIPPFGYYIWQERGNGKKIAVLDPWLRMGQSNSADGYLVFRVPAEYDVSDMMLVGNFASFGSAAWRLG